MRLKRVSYGLVAALGLVAGCSSTPASKFYTLSAVPASSAASTGSESVVVGPVSVPDAVNRPQFVVTVGPNQVRLDEFNRWAAPLQDDIARVLAADLAADLATPRVTTNAKGAGQDADYRVAVEVQSFESQPGVAATLAAAWTVRRAKDGRTLSQRTNLQEPVQQSGYAALAAAHSRAIARLAQDIAAAIRSLASDTP
jgi:uncharacterized lipoprotein YmbA